MASSDANTELASMQVEVQMVDEKLAGKQAELRAAPLQDKNLRAQLRLDMSFLEKQKMAIGRRLKAAQVKARKCEVTLTEEATSTSITSTPVDDWTEHVDPQSGKAFYYNAKTAETAWTKPSPSQSGQATEIKMAAEEWTQHVDPQSGNTFYYNATTGETSWTKPSAQATQPLPEDDWTEHADPASGNTFYYKAKTGETSWTKPAASQAQAPAAEACSDWTENVDPASGQMFYYNTKTQESSWTRPACYSPLQTVQPTSAAAA